MIETNAPRFCETPRIEIQYKFANHYEEAVAKAINETGSVNIPNVIKAERDNREHTRGIHTPDINIHTTNGIIKLEVKADGKGLETGNIFIEQKTLISCDFDMILFTPSYWWWEGREERNFAFLFTKEQVRTLALTAGTTIHHAGDNWIDAEGNRINNTGWVVRMEDIPETYKDNTFLQLSKEYHTTYATLERDILLVWDREQRNRKNRWRKTLDRIKNK